MSSVLWVAGALVAASFYVAILFLALAGVRMGRRALGRLLDAGAQARRRTVDREPTLFDGQSLEAERMNRRLARAHERRAA